MPLYPGEYDRGPAMLKTRAAPRKVATPPRAAEPESAPARPALPILTTRARLWLEAQRVPLPDPFTPRDVVAGIENHYPGGRRNFLKDQGVWDTVKRRQYETRSWRFTGRTRSPDGPVYMTAASTTNQEVTP